MPLALLDQLRPGDHACWAFDDRNDFERSARAFLAEGAARHEKTIFINREEARDLYGAATFDPEASVSTFARLLAEARRDGFSGLRAAADLTLLANDDALAPQLARYEHLVDVFERASGATGLCGYDAATVDERFVRDLAALHTHAWPDPGFHLAASADGGLVLSGELDVDTIECFEHALLAARPDDDAVLVDVDVSRLAFIDHRSLLALDELAGSFGGAFALHHTPHVVHRLLEHLRCEHLLVVAA